MGRCGRNGEYLDNNEGHGSFERLGGTVAFSPTITNLNDFRAILIDRPMTP